MNQLRLKFKYICETVYSGNGCIIVFVAHDSKFYDKTAHCFRVEDEDSGGEVNVAKRVETTEELEQQIQYCLHRKLPMYLIVDAVNWESQVIQEFESHMCVLSVNVANELMAKPSKSFRYNNHKIATLQLECCSFFIISTDSERVNSISNLIWLANGIIVERIGPDVIILMDQLVGISLEKLLELIGAYSAGLRFKGNEWLEYMEELVQDARNYDSSTPVEEFKDFKNVQNAKVLEGFIFYMIGYDLTCNTQSEKAEDVECCIVSKGGRITHRVEQASLAIVNPEATYIDPAKIKETRRVGLLVIKEDWIRACVAAEKLVVGVEKFIVTRLYLTGFPAIDSLEHHKIYFKDISLKARNDLTTRILEYGGELTSDETLADIIIARNTVEDDVNDRMITYTCMERYLESNGNPHSCPVYDKPVNIVQPNKNLFSSVVFTIIVQDGYLGSFLCDLAENMGGRLTGEMDDELIDTEIANDAYYIWDGIETKAEMEKEIKKKHRVYYHQLLLDAVSMAEIKIDKYRVHNVDRKYGDSILIPMDIVKAELLPPQSHVQTSADEDNQHGKETKRRQRENSESDCGDEQVAKRPCTDDISMSFAVSTTTILDKAIDLLMDTLEKLNLQRYQIPLMHDNNTRKLVKVLYCLPMYITPGHGRICAYRSEYFLDNDAPLVVALLRTWSDSNGNETKWAETAMSQLMKLLVSFGLHSVVLKEGGIRQLLCFFQGELYCVAFIEQPDEYTIILRIQKCLIDCIYTRKEKVSLFCTPQLAIVCCDTKCFCPGIHENPPQLAWDGIRCRTLHTPVTHIIRSVVPVLLELSQDSSKLVVNAAGIERRSGEELTAGLVRDLLNQHDAAILSSTPKTVSLCAKCFEEYDEDGVKVSGEVLESEMPACNKCGSASTNLILPSPDV